MITLLFACVFGIISGSIPAFKNSNTITIYHTNDIHGAVESAYTPEGKLIQIGFDVIKSLKDNTPNSILIDAGDATQGGILASSSQGSKIIELMNETGYDVMTLGNHEFDYGTDVLKLNLALAKFKILSANVYDENGDPLMKNALSNGCNTIIERNGKRIGFFGLTTCAARYTTHPKNVENIEFRDEIQTAKEQYRYLRQQNVDMIICIAHIGKKDSEVTSEMIAKAVPGIDIIIDGHSHEVYSETVGHTLIQQVGTKSKNIGKIEIEFKDNKTFNIFPSIIKATQLINPLESGSPQYIPDSKISKMYREMIQKASEAFKIVIGKTKSCLYGGEYKKIRICRLQDTNLGNLISDALVNYGKKFLAESKVAQNAHIVSLQNGGGIRASILPKFISVGDIVNVFPFPNKISVKIATPAQLYEVLENGFKSIYMKDGILCGPDGAFPNVGGMRIEFDINGEPMDFNAEKDKVISAGSRVRKIVLIDSDGNDTLVLERNDNETQLILVTNNFETSGGDQYIMLKNLPSLTDEGDFLKDLLCDYIRQNTFSSGEITNYPVTMSRLKLIGEEKLFSNYDATITIKENSTELKNEDVCVQLDENTSFTACTDENGTIIIKDLKQGPHNIKISKKNRSMDALVNNRVGIKNVDVFLEDTSGQDISDVINIIDGIPYQKIADINGYVKFARDAYESLPDENKSLITNYENLVNAEKANQALNPAVNKTSQKSTYDFKALAAALILILVSYLIVLKVRRSGIKQNNM